MIEISPDRVKSSAAYLLFYRRRTARPIGGAKSRELVESANASRNASVAGSEVGGSSPYASRENLLSTSTDDFFGLSHSVSVSDDEVPVPGRFTGMGPSPLSHFQSSASFQDPMNAPPSPPESAEPGSPRDLNAFDDWLESEVPPLESATSPETKPGAPASLAPPIPAVPSAVFESAQETEAVASHPTPP